MGLCFRWFKDYKILDTGESYLAFGFCYCDEFSVDFIDSDKTSHSYYNVSLVCDLFERLQVFYFQDCQTKNGLIQRNINLI